MTEPSSNVPEDIANPEFEEDQSATDQQPALDLKIDDEKREAWDRIKTDYEAEPHGEPVPNSMDTAQSDVAEAEDDEAQADEDDGDEGDDEVRTEET